MLFRSCRAAHQCLHLDQVGAHAVGRSAHGDAAQRLLVVRQQDLGRVVHAPQAAVQHLEHPDFERRAETVLYAAQDAVDNVESRKKPHFSGISISSVLSSALPTYLATQADK